MILNRDYTLDVFKHMMGDGSDKNSLTTVLMHRCTVLSLIHITQVALAMRHALGKGATIGSELVSVLEQLFLEQELQVREESLRLLSAALLKGPAILETRLSELILQRVLDSMSFKQVVEVDLGPFKQKNDLGAPLRRLALDCADALIAVMPDSAGSLLDMLPPLLKDEDGIKLHAYKLLGRLCKVRPMAVVSRVDIIIEPLSKTLFAKPSDNKKGPELERALEVVKSAVRVAVAVDNVVAASGSGRWAELMEGIKKSPTLSDFHKAVLAEAE